MTNPPSHNEYSDECIWNEMYESCRAAHHWLTLLSCNSRHSHSRTDWLCWNMDPPTVSTVFLHHPASQPWGHTNSFSLQRQSAVTRLRNAFKTEFITISHLVGESSWLNHSSLSHVSTLSSFLKFPDLFEPSSTPTGARDQLADNSSPRRADGRGTGGNRLRDSSHRSLVLKPRLIYLLS